MGEKLHRFSKSSKLKKICFYGISHCTWNKTSEKVRNSEKKDLPLEVFPANCQNYILHAQRGILRKFFFIENVLVVINCGNWARKIKPFAQNFFCRVEKAGSNVSRGTIWGKSSRKFLSIIFGQGRKKLRPFGRRFSRGRQSFFLRVHKSFGGKFRLKIHKFFSSFLVIEQKLSVVCQKFFGVLSKARSMCRK